MRLLIIGIIINGIGLLGWYSVNSYSSSMIKQKDMVYLGYFNDFTYSNNWHPNQFSLNDNYKYQGIDLSPLIIVCIYGYDDFLLDFIKRGADINTPDRVSADYALTFLFSENIRKHGKTPLHWASEYDHIEIARILLKNGADANVLAFPGESALDYAKSSEMKALLRQHGSSTFNEHAQARNNQYYESRYGVRQD
jgi:ankyrin repeat protein